MPPFAPLLPAQGYPKTKQSQPFASSRTTYKTEPINLAPSVQYPPSPSCCLHRSAQKVAQLEAPQAIATLCLLADNIQDRVNQFGTGLTKDEAVWTEELTKGVHQNGMWHVAVSNCFLEVHIDGFKLHVKNWLHFDSCTDNPGRGPTHAL